MRKTSLAAWLVFGLIILGVSRADAIPSAFQTDRAAGVAAATTQRERFAQADPATQPDPASPQAEPAPADPTQVDPAPPAAAAPYVAQPDAAPDEPLPIGSVAKLTGSASVTRNNESYPLSVKDDIYKNDVLQTAANSALDITFADATTFSLISNSRIAIDEFVYAEGGSGNAAAFDIAKGTVAFVAAAVAKTGDMKIATPTATLGIRGTSGVVEVPEPGTAAARRNVAIKLYPDPDGRVGRIEVNGRDGARLGMLTQGATGFAIRPMMGGGVRFAAMPMLIPPQMVARDRGIVQRVHAAQVVGRQMVMQRRIELRNNPALRQNLQRQPGLNRQPGLQRLPGLQPGQQRPGQMQQNGRPQSPGLQRQNNLQQRQPGLQNPNRLTQQPGSPRLNGVSPGQPGPQRLNNLAQQPGMQRQGAVTMQRLPGQFRPALPRAASALRAAPLRRALPVSVPKKLPKDIIR